MTHLIYCLFRDEGSQETERLEGVGGQPVGLVSKNELSAACSELASPELTPDIAGLLAYKEVIESFHRDRTLIPMRYGCLFDDASQIVRHLEERYQWYRSLLEELNGCVEMGVRVLLSGENHNSALRRRADQRGPESTKAPPVLAGQTGQPSGKAYLAARRSHYATKERIDEQKKMVAQRCRAALAGLFRKCVMENSSATTLWSPLSPHLLSLYFLTPRDSVESFRRAFRQMGAVSSAKLLLSGPWPPYNFVSSNVHQEPDSAGRLNGNI